MTSALDRLPIKALAARLGLLFAATYGLFYFSYKFLLPYGDWTYYYPLYQSPLNIHAAQSPFVLRQFGAILVWIVWRLHIFYPNEIAYSDAAYDTHVFFAALLVNYVCLLIAALVAGLTAEEFVGRRNALLAALAGFFCFLSFHSQAAVITTWQEGPAWMLLALAFLAFVRGSRVWIFVLLALATFERELILLAMGFLAGLSLLPVKRPFSFKALPRTSLLTLGWSMVCFFVYLGLRHLSQGWDFQANPGSLAKGMVKIVFNRELLTQGFLSQNIILIALACFFAYRLRIPAVDYWLPCLLATFAFLALVSLGSYEGNNVGRLAGILTPLFAACAAVTLFSKYVPTPEAPGVIALPTALTRNPNRLILVGLSVFAILLGVLAEASRIHRQTHPKHHKQMMPTEPPS